MDGSGEFILTLFLFAGLFFNWIKAAISAAIAVLVRSRPASIATVLAVGAIEGLVGSRLELLDIYLTRDGWESIDVLALFTVVLSAIASLIWWLIARGLYSVARRLWQPAGAR